MEALAPEAPPTVMAWLEAETSESMERVAQELDMLGEQTSWLDYRLYLFRMYGFHIAAERALAAASRLSTVIGDADLRNNKVALVAHDLVALGVSRRDLQQLPRMSVPPMRELADAVGWMYVVERATLDARQIGRHLRARLPLELGTACAYVSCYGDEVDTRWRELGEGIEQFAAAPAIAERVAAAANDCLLRLLRWVGPTSASPGAASRSNGSHATAKRAPSSQLSRRPRL